jgi:hypothetical protein
MSICRPRFVELAEEAPKLVATNQKIILGVDRLDYTKGLVHRLRAFERLLEKHPEHIQKVGDQPSQQEVRQSLQFGFGFHHPQFHHGWGWIMDIDDRQSSLFTLHQETYCVNIFSSSSPGIHTE